MTGTIGGRLATGLSAGGGATADFGASATGLGAGGTVGATGVRAVGGAGERGGTIVGAGICGTTGAAIVGVPLVWLGAAGSVTAGTPGFTSCTSLRVIPIPVRSVLRACSSDTGFVSTRLAPSRNAFGTPALPSTMAIAIEVLFRFEARALLNTCVAVWALSQSTMSKSKRCVA